MLASWAAEEVRILYLYHRSHISHIKGCIAPEVSRNERYVIGWADGLLGVDNGQHPQAHPQVERELINTVFAALTDFSLPGQGGGSPQH